MWFPLFIKQLTNINKQHFLKLLTNEIHICNFSTMDDILVGKVNISASLRKIHFPEISEQAPLMLLINVYIKKSLNFLPPESTTFRSYDLLSYPNTALKNKQEDIIN